MKIALIAANGRPVTFEPDGTVRANRDDILGWETLEVVKNENGTRSFKGGPDGKFLCAEGGGGGALVANRDAAGPWEEFEIDGELRNGEEISLFTHNQHYVCCEAGSDDPILVANRTARGAWEVFRVKILEADAVNVPPTAARTGLVRQVGRSVMDDNGFFNPLGLTFFWGLYGVKHERDRVLEHLKFYQPYGYDYLRILGEVDWKGRTIDPNWSDYQNVLAEQLDMAYAHGLRCQITVIGGREGNKYGLRVAQMCAEVVNAGRQHTVVGYEVVNERHRLDKMGIEEMVQVGRWLRDHTPHLVGLTAPANGDDEHDPSTYKEVLDAAKRSGAQMFMLHTRRKDHDFNWAQVRQGYDFSSLAPYVGNNNEPPGLQSSVRTLSSPRKTALMRATSIICGAPFFCNHVGQGVTATPVPEHGRPADAWDVPGFDAVSKAVRSIDVWIPDQVQNWRVANNGRNWHPLPLPPKLGEGFWEGSKPGNVNKNYAAVSGDEFVEVVLGVKARADGDLVNCGKAEHACEVKAVDPETGTAIDAELDPGESLLLPGRVDTDAGYIVDGWRP